MQRHRGLLPRPVLHPHMNGPCFMSPPVIQQIDNDPLAAVLNSKETNRSQASTRNPLHTSEVFHLRRASMKMESLKNCHECCQSPVQDGDRDTCQRQPWQVQREGRSSTKNHRECCKMLQHGDNDNCQRQQWQAQRQGRSSGKPPPGFVTEGKLELYKK